MEMYHGEDFGGDLERKRRILTMRVAAIKETSCRVSNCSTHSFSCVGDATAHGSAMSVWKNVSPSSG